MTNFIECFLKSSVLCKRAEVKYAVIHDNTTSFPIRLMYRLGSVSNSNDDAWLNKVPSKQAQANHRLTLQIKAVFDKQRERTGAIRVTKLLQAQGKKVGRYLLRSCAGKAGGHVLQGSIKQLNNPHLVPNLLKQDFKASCLNEK